MGKQSPMLFTAEPFERLTIVKIEQESEPVQSWFAHNEVPSTESTCTSPSAVLTDLLPGFGSTVPDYANPKQNPTSDPEESAIKTEANANYSTPMLNQMAMDYLCGRGMTQDLAFFLGYHMGQKEPGQGRIPASIQPEVCEVHASSPDSLLPVISDPRGLVLPSVDPNSFVKPKARMLPGIVKQLNAQDDSVPEQPSDLPKRKRKRRNTKKGFDRVRQDSQL